MTSPRSHAELVTVRKLAQELATRRKERLSSVHLLAAIASDEGPAGDLLRERRLDEEALLKAVRSVDDEVPDPIGRAMGTARDVAKRAAAKEPSALHLLLALLSDRRSGAHRALVQSGADLARLRTSALQIALGVVQARRVPARVAPRKEGRPAPRGPGMTVPFFPPPARADANAPAKPAAPAEPPPRAAVVSNLRRDPSGRAPALRRQARDAAPEAPAKAVAPARTGRFALDRTRFPALCAMGRNLTLAAAEGELEPTIGRRQEIEQVLDVLAKRHANNPCVIGPAGVGKTSVARGVAHRLVEQAETGGVPRVLVEIVVSELLAGTGARGALAERMASLRAELREAGGRVILFIDELHELFGSGALDEAMAEIKLALARGELSLIGATTPEEYRKAIEPDAALARRFTLVEIEEPGEEDAFLLLQSVAVGLGAHHGLTFTDEALASAIAWSIRYLPGRALPDKALSILDLAGARTRRRAPPHPCHEPEVGPPEVAAVVAELADIPVERLLETDRERMLGLEALLAERVVGHEAALARIARVLRRNAAGLRARRPIGSFLLLGPTGVGKTEAAKAIAEALFHSPDAMTRLDFSEYAEAHAVARLIGAPPGYIGHEAGGQLTEAVRRRPYQVILLDEIEKAHRDVLEAFLQVFDEGRLTDGRGRRVDFTNAVIVMTSNLGAAEAGAIRAERAVGFGRAAAAPQERLSEAMIRAARTALPPELYNRIDEVLCFAPLTREDVAEIARRLLGGLKDSLSERDVRLDVDPAAIEALLDAGGFDAEYGARPMRRAIARLIEAPLAEIILRGELPSGAVALVGVEGGEIVVDALPGARAAG
jgi:ATP-dependent Clp protease ATP-binding subunit ClpC